MPSIDRSMAISRHTLTALVTQTFYPKAHLLISPKWMCLKPIWPSNICICHTYSTRTADEVTKQYHKQGMRQFVYRLSPTERRDLLKELRTEHEAGSTVIPDPTPAQLRYVAIFSAIPFVGFGLLDNTIMLMAGEYIDIYFGAWLGITTMAAAALGNMVSDVLGILTAGFVEQAAAKLGVRAPTVTLEQMSLHKTKWMANLGRCIGVCIGCTLGMWPLYVFAKEDDEEKNDKEKHLS